MEIIPLIILEKHGLSKKDLVLIENLKHQNNEEKKLYIIDQDGIKKNKPNLALYQKFSKYFDTWVDNGPRDLGDVVDTFMTGATSITLRTETWPLIDIESIREISENRIFQLIKHDEASYTPGTIFPNVDGYVIFKEKKSAGNDFKTDYYYKQFITKNKTYIYDKNINKLRDLADKKPAGVLIDLENYQEFKKHGF